MKKKKMMKIACGVVMACLTMAVLDSCAPVVNYLALSVPEEGGIRFTQITQADENVLGPIVQRNPVTNVLEWYAAPLIAVSPDGGKVAFLGRKNGKDNMYLKNTGGGRSTIQRTFRDNVDDMAFSPDGTKIAFSDHNGADVNIFMIGASEGAAIQQVTTTSSVELGPCFAPDGKSIYFSRSENGRFYVWNVSLETSLLTQFSEGFTPAISRDGNTLVITRNNKESNRGEIWAIDLEKGIETLILSDTERGFSSPQISPDGMTIALVGSNAKTKTSPENLNLYTVRLDGTGLTQLTFHPGLDASPVWAPDGKGIYFISSRGTEKGQGYNVWRMDYKK